MNQRSEHYRVGELAELTNKTVRALRLYEERGLLKPQSRSRGGYRLYGTPEVDRVRLIDALQSVGMSLSEIAELVEDYESAGERETGVVELRAAYRRRLRVVNDKIEMLMAVKDRLTNGINFLDWCVPCPEQSDDCACRDCDRLATDESDLLMVTGMIG